MAPRTNGEVEDSGYRRTSILLERQLVCRGGGEARRAPTEGHHRDGNNDGNPCRRARSRLNGPVRITSVTTAPTVAPLHLESKRPPQAKPSTGRHDRRYKSGTENANPPRHLVTPDGTERQVTPVAGRNRPGQTQFTNYR